MNEKPGRDLSILAHPSIKNEGDLVNLVRCVDRENFSWGSMREGTYCETEPSGLYWILRSLGESIGIHPDLKFFDIGFGSGTVLATFAVLGYKTYGIDMREQPMKHAPGYFERVQNIFGRFKHQPQIIMGEASEESRNEFLFPDLTKINEMDLYYAYVNNETSSTPALMKMISPKAGSRVIHFSSHFHTPDHFEFNARESPHLYPDGPLKIPTYKGLGFRLVNQDKQNMKEFEEDGSGFMQLPYNPIFVKE